MYEDGVNNDFENAHQQGLRRGFDLGWSYKGKFDRQIIRDEIEKNKNTSSKHLENEVLKKILKKLEQHPNNRENITFNCW